MSRPFTPDERAAFAEAAMQIRDELDAELGDLLLRVAAGEESALTLACERLEEIGCCQYAARLRMTLDLLAKGDAPGNAWSARGHCFVAVAAPDVEVRPDLVQCGLCRAHCRRVAEGEPTRRLSWRTMEAAAATRPSSPSWPTPNAGARFGAGWGGEGDQ
jgi:hypothetical protein